MPAISTDPLKNLQFSSGDSNLYLSFISHHFSTESQFLAQSETERIQTPVKNREISGLGADNAITKMVLLAEFWKQPPKYMLACMLCSANGILFGMDTGIIGPVTDMKAFKAAFGGSQNATIHGLIVSSILIPAALSSFFAGHLADKLGRSMGIAIGTLVFGVGAAIEAAAVSLGMFIAGRVVEGLGEGLFLGTLVVYICEVSPTRQRGPLTTGPQLVITSGICIGYFTCYGTSKHIHTSFSWRTPFIILASLSMVLSAASFLMLPASPRWLTLHGREAEAAQAWDDLGVSHAEREKVELEVTAREVEAPTEEQHHQEERLHKLLDIFSKDVRSRTTLAVFMMAMQQLSGIDGVLYVSPTRVFMGDTLTKSSTHRCSSSRLDSPPPTQASSHREFPHWLSSP